MAHPAGMRSSEIHARAVIAAALITSGTIVVPPIPITGAPMPGPEARRLRAMTDHLYDVLTGRDHRDSGLPRELRRSARRATA